ncbi:Uncharacterized protein BP5553_03036 [Venustampulla echinocandica]|uniref:Major facilitator superfamily (MFS) profile domain-containing protein n=1 Tax=Venustampulla echinocandica TaxID=2656787 RepID=A0A370TT40_9HELO|nr:Uncharacterized protein BP5553_03036 [Venustampulla echinocandica]RDL38696.1 Uncharacterized protein BP5553_03036 [Venustampulla echinocandica]
MEEGKPNPSPDGTPEAADAHEGRTKEPKHIGTKEVVVSPSIADPDNKAAAISIDTDDHGYLTGIKRTGELTGIKLTVIIAALSVTSFLLLLDMSIVSTAVPRITSDFHSLTDIGWYGSAYLLSRIQHCYDLFQKEANNLESSCALQPMTGKIFSQFDSKLGSLLSAVATSSNIFIVGRAVAGMGASGLSNGGLTIIALSIPLQKRAVYMGILMGISQLGVLFGPLLGGALTEHASWRWCFYINLPAGALAAIFLFFIRIPSHHTKRTDKPSFRSILKSLDLVGFILFAPAAIMFLLALQWGGNTYKWDSATIIGLFCGSAATVVVFIGWEYTRGDSAMIPLSMVKKRPIASSCMVQLFQFGSMLSTSYYLAIYFQAVRGFAPTLSGVYMLPSILSQLMLGIVSGILVGRLGYYLPFIIFGTGLTSIGSGLMSTLTPTSATGAWIGYQIISGAGRGGGLQMPILAIQSNLKPQEIPVGMGLGIFCQSIGGALFLSFAQTIFSTSLVDALPDFAPEVDAQAVINAGAAGARDIVSKALLPGVLLAYNQAVSHVFYLAAGASAVAFVFSWGMGWKSVKKAKVVTPAAE